MGVDTVIYKQVVAKPVDVASFGTSAPARPSGDLFVLAPCATLVTLVGQSWSTFSSPTIVHGALLLY